MANPNADFPTAVHTATDTTAGANTALGKTTPKHTEVHGKIEQEVVAVQTKVGIGSSTPTVNKYLKGTGVGTSEWADIALADLGGASSALDNLASTAINTSLISDTDSTDDLGSNDKKWKDVYAETINSPVGRGATLTVAANNATALEKAQADYVCDGVADNVQIQAALDALPAAGGQVILSEGVFNITTGITLPTTKPFTLRGQGMRGTLLKVTSGANIDILTYSGLAPASYVPANFDYFKIADMEIDGDKTKQASGRCIRLVYADYFILESLSVINAKTMGIRLENCDEGVISKCFISQNGTTYTSDAGIYSTSGTHDLAITACMLELNVGAGVFLNGTYEQSITSCNMWSNSYDIYLNGAAVIDNVISGNVLEDAGAHSILLVAAQKNIITNNRIITATTDGIRMNDALDNVINANIITGCGGIGIDERLTSDRNIISSNSSRSNTGGNLTVVGASTVNADNIST